MNVLCGGSFAYYGGGSLYLWFYPIQEDSLFQFIDTYKF